MATCRALENWRALVRPLASPMAALILASQSLAGAICWPWGLGSPVAAMVSAACHRVSCLGDDDCLLPRGGTHR
jgi:hypothetical protein